MARGEVCSAALLAVLVCLAVIGDAGAARSHEAFDRSSYYESSDGAVVTQQLKDTVEVTLPGKTTETTATGPETADESTIPQTTSTTAQDQPQEQQHRDYRGVSKPQGDYVSDAKPWWANPQYSNYGNYVQGRNPQVYQQQQQDPNNRYPNGYPNQNYYSQNPNPAGVQYSASTTQQHQQQYSQNQFSQYSGVVPYAMTTGGCPTQYWISNTQRWPAFFTVRSSIGDALGGPATKVFGETTILQALLNSRPDGYSTLLRSGATAILNSYARSQYKYSHVTVIESFADALKSSQAAAEQAAHFEEANMSAYSEQHNSCA